LHRYDSVDEFFDFLRDQGIDPADWVEAVDAAFSEDGVSEERDLLTTAASLSTLDAMALMEDQEESDNAEVKLLRKYRGDRIIKPIKNKDAEEETPECVEKRGRSAIVMRSPLPTGYVESTDPRRIRGKPRGFDAWNRQRLEDAEAVNRWAAGQS